MYMTDNTTNRVRLRFMSYLMCALLHLSFIRRSAGENRIDLKTLYYQESDSRMQIISPTFMTEYDLSPTLTIKIDGIYNSISGATPSGAPPLKATTTYTTLPQTGGGTFIPAPVAGGDDDHDADDDDDFERIRSQLFGGQKGAYYAKAGATPTAAPAAAPSPSSSGGDATTTVANTVEAYDKDGKAPRADVEDERYGVNIELAKRLGRHTIVLQGAYS